MPKQTKPSRQPKPAFPASAEDGFEIDSYVQGQTLPPSWSAEACAQWFFSFLRTDLTTLTPGQLLGMSADIWAFVRPELIVKKSWGDAYLPPIGTLEALQRDARAGIQRVREGEWYELKDGIGYGIARLGDDIIRGSRRGTFEDLFRAAAMDTVQTFWDRLHECPRCHAIFLKVGKRKYCSATCARRTHWDSFKERRPNRDHHRDYKSRVQNRLGAHAKVLIKRRKKK